ncbi:MAG: exosortase F system-associated protein [Cryomorphaceae bacterium]|nr:exosortase F system-associated protein [Cryomorphaceae bacterium]
MTILIGVLGLAVIYIFQRDLFYSGFSDAGASTVKVPDFDATRFIWHKFTRLLLNDTFSLFIIFGIFLRKDFIQFGFKLLLIEVFIILPIYLSLSIYMYEYTRFFLQHIHRLIVNPVLMMLLIPAFFYQQHKETQ